MTTWILILVLTNQQGLATQIETVATPFQTFEDCNFAGSEARTLPVLTPPGPWERNVWSRIDWVCVPNGPVKTAREVCSEREAALERMREEFRKASRRAAEETDRALGLAKKGGEG